MNTKAKTKTMAGARHYFALRTPSGNIVSGFVTVPGVRRPARWCLTWDGHPSREDEQVSRRWITTTVSDVLSEAAGQEVEMCGLEATQ